MDNRDANFSSRTSGNRERETIEETATAWLGKRDAGLSAKQMAEFVQWLRCDPRHQETFMPFDVTLRALDKLAVLRPSTDAEPDPDLPLRRSFRVSIWVPLTLAIAAAVAMCFVGWWRPPSDPMIFSQTAVTEVGGLRKVALPDGSVMDLNTDSAVSIRFTAGMRQVRLIKGEAHFAVAKNPARPFVVEAQGITVRAVGTAFVVRLRPESVDVLVTEGRVRVNDRRQIKSSAASPSQSGLLLVGAGQRAEIPFAPDAAARTPMAVTVAPAEVSQMLAWEDRRLEFDPTPLSALVAEFNRYNHHKLVVADSAIAGLKLGGSFRVNDYDTLVRLLESSFGVTAERSRDKTVLRRAVGLGR